MKHFWKIVICLLGGVVLNTGLGADSPYTPIAARNIFGLNPPQPQNITPPEPPSKITLNGIMTIFGTTQALFYVDVPPRPPAPATQKSYILSEGQGQDEIEVTQINEKTGVVTFNNHGVVQEIPLVKAGPISTPTPVVMNSGFTTPAAAPGGYNSYGGSGNTARFGNRIGQNRNTGNNGANAGQNSFGNTGPGGVASGSTGGQAQPQLSPEEQTVLIAAQKAQAKQAGDPSWIIYPPTELDQAAGTVNTAQPGSPSP
ncbi:MAG: hypothetical protein WBS33_11020 [Verrucomicrobiia bacterium]